MGARVFTVVCAWCNRTITAGATSTPVTHTICPSCIDWTLTHQHLDFDTTDVEYFELPPRPIIPGKAAVAGGPGSHDDDSARRSVSPGPRDRVLRAH